MFGCGGRPDQTLIPAGAGAGLSRLYGILRDALRVRHTGSIHLFHGARGPSGLYRIPELRELAAQHGRLHPHVCWKVSQCVAIGTPDRIRARIPKLAGCRAWVCGDPELVRALKKKLFLGATALSQISA